MGFFNKVRTDGATFDGQGEERKGLFDVIQYNGNQEDLVWKFPYNNLSIGALLIVNKSQEAVFVKGGVVCDVFGEGTHTLSSKNRNKLLNQQKKSPILKSFFLNPHHNNFMIEKISSAKVLNYFVGENPLLII